MNLLADVQLLVSLAIDNSALAKSMNEYAIEQMRLSGGFTKEQIDHCQDEDREDSDEALAYWSYTSQYYRKLLTAAAASFSI